MDTKIPKDKSKGLKIQGRKIWPIPAKTVAEVVGCSENMVRAIRREDRNEDTDLGTKIAVADRLLVDGANKLLEEVKRVVRFK